MPIVPEYGSIMPSPTAAETKSERIGIPHVGDVVACEAFANGWRRWIQPDVPQEGPVWVTDVNPLKHFAQRCLDPSRSMARFVVEESFKSDCVVTWNESCRGGGYGDPDHWTEERHAYARQIIARRLDSDGAYDPEGEQIQFYLWGHDRSRGYSDDSERQVRQRGIERPRCILETPLYKVGTMQRIVRFV